MATPRISGALQLPTPHPKGEQARVLLTSVFGPFGQDDEYGGRAVNPMELYHNQVTKAQGPFSLRMFHRSWGLMLIQANLDAACTLLDFPTLARFTAELQDQAYDVIGIGAIIPNVGKVEAMCRLIRQYQPQATIVIGGHVANIPDLAERVDADHIVRGDGVRWMRHFLGQDTDRPLRHPLIWSGHGRRALGVSLPSEGRDGAATVIPSVGCPMGCNFCATSAMFGGKGEFLNFYETGDELFAIMCQLEREMQVQAFFMMDENFLLHRKRALRLLELMQEHDKSWSLYAFSSANALKTYTMAQLVGLGISWVWMGIEGEDSRYAKLRDTDSRILVRELQAHGVRVLGSTIIGLETHTEANIDEAIDYAVSHDTEFHQFMLYTPVPGTPLYREHQDNGTLLDQAELPHADRHGQYRFAHRHPHIPAGRETALLQRAFDRDFAVNGPSVLRVIRSTMAGWARYKDHADARIRRRFAREMTEATLPFAGGLWAARSWFKGNVSVQRRIDATLATFYAQQGWTARLAAPVLGRIMLFFLRQEERRLKKGWAYEPPTFYDDNLTAAALRPAGTKTSRLRWVEPGSKPVPAREAVIVP